MTRTKVNSHETNALLLLSTKTRQIPGHCGLPILIYVIVLNPSYFPKSEEAYLGPCQTSMMDHFFENS